MSSGVEWVPCTNETAPGHYRRALVGGREIDGTDLWVIRAKLRHDLGSKEDLIPGKLAVKHKNAWVAWYGGEHKVYDIEVLCVDPDNVCWVDCKRGGIHPKAIVGGYTASGDTLYIGRAEHGRSLVIGKVQPTHKCMYISWAGQELVKSKYELLCNV